MFNPDPKNKRYKSEKYLDYIRSLPCLICGKQAEPHHVKTDHNSGMARKPDDTYSIPLSRRYHDEIEKIGTSSFCEKYGINIYKELFLLTKNYIENNFKKE